MSSWSPFFALAIFPLAYFVAINPVGFSWNFRHGLNPMPPELLERAQHIDRYVVTIRNAIALSLLAALILHQSITARQVGLHLNNWLSNSLIGVFAGLMVLTLQGMVRKFLPVLNKNPNNPELQSGPAWFWIVSTPVELSPVPPEKFSELALVLARFATIFYIPIAAAAPINADMKLRLRIC